MMRMTDDPEVTHPSRLARVYGRRWIAGVGSARMSEDESTSVGNHLRQWREATIALEASERALRAAQSAVAAAIVAADAAEITAADADTAREAVSQVAASARAAAEAAREAVLKAGIEVTETQAEVAAAESRVDDARRRHHEAQEASFRRYGYGPSAADDTELDPIDELADSPSR
jgi:hypothetical protein